MISADWILFLVRVVVGGTFVFYGWPKIRDLQANASDFIKMGFVPGWLWGTAVAMTEFIGGTLLVLGIVPSVIGLVYAFHMLLGTFWKIKIKKPFTNYSYDILLFSLALVLATFGGGMFTSIDVYLPLLRWDIAILAVLVALAMAFMKEIIGFKKKS